MARSECAPDGARCPTKGVRVSQAIGEKAGEAEARTQETLVSVRQVRVVIRGKDGAEVEIRMVVEGFLREATVIDPGQREGSKPPATRSSSPKGRTVTSSTPRLSAPQRSSG